MNKNFNKIIEDAKTFSLSEDDKKSVMNKVSIFIKENPINSVSEGILTPYMKDEMNEPYGRHNMWDSVRSPFPILSIFRKNKFMLITLILAFVLSGGTSFAASSSLPGDFLYPVKIHVNENIKSFVAFGDNADAKVEIEKANERLKEQETLSSRGEVNAETKAEIKANFVEHEKKVKKIIGKVEAKGDTQAAARINSDFESVLKLHNDAALSIGLINSRNINEVNTTTNNNLDSKINVESGLKTKINPSLNSKDYLEVKTGGMLDLNSTEKSSTTSPSNNTNTQNNSSTGSSSSIKINNNDIKTDSSNSLNLGL